MNDTIIRDLFTVPIFISEDQLSAINLTKLSLCYQVQGDPGEWFNLVTDECVSVNGHYTSHNGTVTAMDSIGVRAVDNAGHCVNIGVDVNECAATVNGALLSIMGRCSSEGVNVRRYKNRVRISVPNCAEITLVMWAICERHTPELTPIDVIKFVVMRGLNDGNQQAHGLIGNYCKRGDSTLKVGGLKFMLLLGSIFIKA